MRGDDDTLALDDNSMEIRWDVLLQLDMPMPMSMSMPESAEEALALDVPMSIPAISSWPSCRESSLMMSIVLKARCSGVVVVKSWM